jgi:hypothetical protein
MRLRDTAWQLPLRLVSGAGMVDPGLGNRNADETIAKQLHGFATGAYPVPATVDRPRSPGALSAGEVTLGALLLSPPVPAAVAETGLLGYAAALLGLHARTPGMRRPNTLHHTPDAVSLAKDSWLRAIGAALVLGARSWRPKRR